MNQSVRLLKKFYIYQKERFPILLLALGLLPAILSSDGIVSGHNSLFLIGISLILSLLYLLHIRIRDEERDFVHDSIHHATRPLHRGLITRSELQIIDRTCVCLFLLMTFLLSTYAFIFGLCMLGYSYIAGKEFFMGERAHRYFMLYNAINILQMFLLQILIYLIFGWRFLFTPFLALHFIFTCTGTILFEFIRKVHLPGEEGSGNDTYTSRLGFQKALGVEMGIIFANSLFFLWIISLLTHSSWWEILTLLIFLYAIGITLMHSKKKTMISNGIMQLTIVGMYAIYNIVIFIHTFH